MAASSRELDALREMRHVAMNAEQFVAMPQSLTLRVDEKQDRTPGMIADRGDHAFRHRQRQLDADLGMIRRSHDCEYRIAAVPAARQQITLRHDIVTAVEKAFGHSMPIHHGSL